MRVLLVQPPGRKRFRTPPMGLLYLARVLLPQNDIQIVDLDAVCQSSLVSKGPTELVRILDTELRRIEWQERASVPIVVGVGPVMTPGLKSAIATVKALRTRSPKTLLVAGGPHFAAGGGSMADEFFERCPELDRIVVGDGEEPLKQLVEMESVQRLNPDTVVPGTYRPGHPWTRAYYAEFAAIRELPRYLLARYEKNYILSPRRRLSSNRWAPAIVFTSRGCPYDCAFCLGSAWRRLRPVTAIIEELSSLVQDGYTQVVFFDDLFATAAKAERQRIRRLCENILNQKLPIEWECELRADVIVRFGRELLELMSTAGCRLINVGIEKTSDEGLANVRKRLNWMQVRKAVDLVKDIPGIRIGGTFIIGGPGEDRNMAVANVDRSLSLSLDEASWYIAKIHPGTDFYQSATEEGLISRGLAPFLNPSGYPLYLPKGMLHHETERLIRSAYRRFYFARRRIAKQLWENGFGIELFMELAHHATHAFGWMNRCEKALRGLHR